MTVTDEVKPDDALLPIRHPQEELFLCDLADAFVKDDTATMEHPFYALSKKTDHEIRRYENGNKWLEVHPGAKGAATIYDKDILIYCTSQLMARANMGQPITQEIRIVAKDLLVFINRGVGGKDYESLKEAFHRLDGTRIRTNITTGDEVTHEGFGLIEHFKIIYSEKSKRVSEISLKLSDWVFRSINKKDVLTIHRDYFRLAKPIERRVYELCRKHCGHQDQWRVSLKLLKSKTGSRAPLSRFRFELKKIEKTNHLPGYTLHVDDQDFVTITNRNCSTSEPEIIPPESKIAYPILDTDTYEVAKMVAPRLDVYALEKEWHLMWENTGCPKLTDPSAAFLGFCKKKMERASASGK